MKRGIFSALLLSMSASASGQCETMASGYYNTTEVCSITGISAYTTEIKSSGPGLVEILNVASSGDTLFGTIDCATRMVTIPDQAISSGDVILSSGVFDAAYDVFTFTFVLIAAADTNFCTSTFHKYATEVTQQSLTAIPIHVRYDNASEHIIVDLPTAIAGGSWCLDVLNAQGNVLIRSGQHTTSSILLDAPLRGSGLCLWRCWNERGEVARGKFIAY